MRGERPDAALMYFYSEFAEGTKSVRQNVRELCDSKGVELLEAELSFSDPIGSWKTIFHLMSSGDLSDQEVTVDITTMPRETIWSIFGLLNQASRSVKWVYHKPESYNREWLSRDPGRPRLVPKLGGIAKFGVRTKLVVISGFDVDRTRQLMNYFEPELTFLGIQSGSQFNNESMNVAKHRAEFCSDPAVKLFELDAYSGDLGHAVLEQQVELHVENCNFILASLGPKPSAIALYRLHKRHPEMGLAYAPSREFNAEYSYGISDTIGGKL